MYKHWGFERVGKKEYEESIGEKKHADKLINRILMLGGLPNLQALHKPMIGENVQEMLKGDLVPEQTAQQTIKNGIAACEQARDYISRQILEEIFNETEEHINWIEMQLDLIDKVSLQNFQQSQMEPDET